jgi:hypothetical protein
MSDKIKPHHLGRKAILYVRQSSAHQVLHNQESRLLQYAMRDRLHALGWREIEVVDDDLGRSAAGSAIRAGFERTVAEVCLGKVGAVAARKVSRFARNSRDWQQLIEMCRVVDTLLLLKEAGFAVKDGKRVTPRGEPISVEFLLDEPSSQPHHMLFIKNLGTLGIEATLRIVDAVQYRKRVDDFDFDLTVQRFGFSSTPGDSLRSFFPRRPPRSGARRISPAYPIRSSTRSSTKSSRPVTALS